MLGAILKSEEWWVEVVVGLRRVLNCCGQKDVMTECQSVSLLRPRFVVFVKLQEGMHALRGCGSDIYLKYNEVKGMWLREHGGEVDCRTMKG